MDFYFRDFAQKYIASVDDPLTQSSFYSVFPIQREKNVNATKNKEEDNVCLAKIIIVFWNIVNFYFCVCAIENDIYDNLVNEENASIIVDS